MSEDVRYKMQHLGDIFVDTLSGVVDSAQRLAKGLVLDYDIRALENKRWQCLSHIGQRIVQLKKNGLSDLMSDESLVELFSEEEQCARYIDSYKKKKHEAGQGGCQCQNPEVRIQKQE